MDRISFDEMCIKMLPTIALRSPCLRRQLGAIIAVDGKIVSTGYNGPPSRHAHCTVCPRASLKSGERLDLCSAVHAEANAIIFARCSVSNGTIYISVSPCKSCAGMIINSGIKRVVFPSEYANTDGIEMLKNCGVVVDTNT